MQAFISYANDGGVSTRFARWIHDALGRPEIPITPWLDYVDLPPVGTFDRRLPTAVNDCDIFLFVRARYTPDSDACMDELRYAREFGKPIIRLLVERDLTYDHLVDFHYDVDFTEDREQALRLLVTRIGTLEKPEGQQALLQEQLRRKRNGLRRLGPAERERAEQEVARLENRLKELQAERQGTAGAFHATPGERVSPRVGHAGFAGRETADIVREIAGDDVPTFLIVGPEGIGKTRLVKSLLEQVTEHRDSDVITVYRQTHGPQSFTANDLTDLLKEAVEQAELETNATRLEQLDAAIARKLEVLMDLFHGKRMVVALDSCEALLDEETGRLVSAELDDALEVLASRRRSVVKLLLVTREQPLVRNRRWLSRAFMLSLDKGLSLPEFKEVLADLDPDDDHGLRHSPEDVVEALHERTGGRPRAAEVVHAILTSPSITESEHSSLVTLADVVAALAGFGPDDALSYLTGRLIDGLAPEERRVLQAVSAFGVPVDADAVEFMLPGDKHAQIDRSLRNLRVSHLVRRTNDNRFYVQPPDDIRAFEAVHPPADDGVSDRRAHIRRAATYFALRRQTEVRGLGDLAADFAEIDLLLQAEDFDAAFRAIERVDDHLDNWGCRWVLRRQRERLHGLLRNDLDELANVHALGDIAMKRDDLPAAESFFRQAMSYLDGYDVPDIQTKLLVSLGGVLQRRDEMAKADGLYRAALKIAQDDARGDEIAALMGLAESCRHWGQLTTAVKHLRRALRLARVEMANSSVPDHQRLLSEISLKVGWRYMELNDFDRAGRSIDEAGTHAAEVDSWELRCRHLDAAANLQLRQQQTGPARENSWAALQLALELGRVPLQRQIYTTLAMCSLLDGDTDEAAANIAAADRGRLPGHALTTLALRGLIESRQGNLEPAQSVFRQLRLEAADRGRRDQSDFGALDMEGFARCGEHLRRVSPPSLRPAIAIFHKARRVTRAPGMTAQLVQLLELFDDARLSPAIAAAAGDDVPR